MRRSGTGTTSRIANTNGAFNIDELACRDVDGGACVDDEFGTLCDRNVILEIHRARPSFRAGHGPLVVSLTAMAEGTLTMASMRDIM